MLYRFKDFEFDSASLVLTKNGDALAIRHNEAKVLALLLERADKVLSKEDILSHIWQDKVVSEQAVFQNISHLRNLFGNDAIKTFPKRGYQWQLETEQAVLNKQTPQDESGLSKQPIIQSSANLPKNRKFPLIAVFTIMVVTLLAVFLNQNESAQESESSSIEIAYIPIKHRAEQQTILLEDSTEFKFNQISHLSYAQFMASAELEYPKLAAESPLVLVGEIRTYNQKVRLDFLLKGPYGDWQGQLSGKSNEVVINQLQTHLKQPIIFDLLNNVQGPEVKQAKLTIAHQNAPGDLIILGELTQSYYSVGEFDKAMVMAEKLAQTAQGENNAQQLGNAFLTQGIIANRKDLIELSTQKLDLAIEQFQIAGDLKRHADALSQKSWLAYVKNDYAGVKASLLKSAQLALEANDIERELHALTYLSVLAHKGKQEEDKYRYLIQAENKMRAYELPTYRFAKIPFHHAIYAKTPSAKEPHLIRVLEYTALTPDHWVAQSSRSQLMNYYIAQNRLTDARALLERATSDNAENSYLKTLLAKAEQDIDAFVHHAQRTFEQAQLAGVKDMSLDVALLICSTPNKQLDDAIYSQFIKENATKNWRRVNESKLATLNL
ncbi:winged helix-turn-helix domain-containing protein [Aliikangiella coralliicola]|uniref:Transcriptional regulator n=1 Tax=Aliikangiella coralliicola TaxID=2592383 RepID=A0A545UJV8_9GAMM|nr:winged helix-turn-helix domain-containing protein [Aliikangiella coralliicola]TQV89750.1 transcriptional regulator [Aliikangiella coralliicola]